MKRARISLSSLAIAGLIGAGLSAAPIGFDDQFAPEFKSAFAKGKGSGKSGGKGGKGGGHGHSGAIMEQIWRNLPTIRSKMATAAAKVI